MPPWGWDEIEAAVPLFPRVSVKLAEQLFEQYGGIVCAVLARGHLPAAIQTMHSALSQANPDEVFQQVGCSSRKVCALMKLDTVLPICLLCCGVTFLRNF